MDLKVGDRVIVTGFYYLTDVGSYGTVKDIENAFVGTVGVKFDKMTGKEVTMRTYAEIWYIQIEDLSLITKLHKYLHGIE